MKIQLHPEFLHQSKAIEYIVSNFDREGVMLGEAVRNKIKIFDLDGKPINIKSFKIPSLFNQVIYKYFRKSKAQRSYEYANRLLSQKIGTPQPIAFLENSNLFGITDSYYISEQLQADLLYRDLTTDPDYPEREAILRQYTKFAFGLHEKGIEFIDNTSGNTLIKKSNDNQYEFYLVDLNRMNFHTDMPFGKRISNLSKLTTREDILKIMSDEYSRLSGHSYEEIFRQMHDNAIGFQERFRRKKRLKKQLKFWKK